jgi:hypothetical protein
VANVPDCIVLKRHRDLEGRGWQIWVRRSLMALISARRELKSAALLLDSGWAEGQTMNTIVPSPISEGSRDGNLLFTLGHVPAGQRFVLFLQFQVNPTTVGSRRQDVVLYDGSERIASIHRTAVYFP